MVLGIIAVVMFAVMFVLTGSVVLPVKSLILTLLSLTASFGALVWVFQEGHLGALGTTVTGTLVANMPILLFCIAFGLSMDYEVFIVARIREFWLASDRTRLANDEAVAQGLAHTGRVVTAAAAIMTISFGALFAAKVSFMRMFGVGLTLAIVLDATVVRMMLLPAFMHLLGRHNWWAPAPIARWHARLTGHPTSPAAPVKKNPSMAASTPNDGCHRLSQEGPSLPQQRPSLPQERIGPLTSGDRAGTPLMTHVAGQSGEHRAPGSPLSAESTRLLDDVRASARAYVGDFVRTECVPRLAHSGSISPVRCWPTSWTAASICARRSCIWAGCRVPGPARPHCAHRPAWSCSTHSRSSRMT